MRIEKLSYHNHVTGWQLAPVEFGSVNLLVGISGVGKTRILEVIRSLQKIAMGDHWYNNKSLNGIEWDITLSTSSKFQYRWCGKFNTIENDDYTIDGSKDNKYLHINQNGSTIESECIYIGENLIAIRNNSIVEFDGKQMPRLSASESLVNIFREEDKITPLFKCLSLIVNSQVQYPDRWMVSLSPRKIEGLSLADIDNTNVTLVDRLGLLSINHPDIFNKINLDLIGIFPQINQIRVSRSHVRLLPLEEELSVVFTLEIKEHNVDSWITQSNISMGMLKTLAHITEIYLSTEGSVILIDEFENSLGVNCIDVVTELLNERKDIQFIITSHHPYIINKIPMQYWKIITRKGSLVTATDATDYNELSGSRHKVFTQLLNLPAYTEGIQLG
jgi:AAA domain, putative AbiEii toxin, Type IV TA system